MSPEFQSLKENIAGLKEHFLNFESRVDGDYTDSELLNCRAYIAFCHAEFEHYLESMALNLLSRATDKWKSHNEVSLTALAVLAFRRREKIGIPDDMRQPGKNTFATMLLEALALQKNVIERNHGIKPKNLSAIFLPLGISGSDLEESLLIQLGNTGEHRGDLVHKSTTASLGKIRDPFADEEKDVSYLVSELEVFDNKLAELFPVSILQANPAPAELPQADT